MDIKALTDAHLLLLTEKFLLTIADLKQLPDQAYFSLAVPKTDFIDDRNVLSYLFTCGRQQKKMVWK